MIKRPQRLIHLLSVLLLAVGICPFARPVALAAANQDVATFSQTVDQANDFQFQAAMAIDQASGQILYQHNAESLQGIASLSKVITLGVVYDAIKQGQLTLEDTVPISAEVAALSTAEGLSNVPLEVSTDRYTVGKLMDAAMVESANAAVVALANLVGGSEVNFVSGPMSAKLKDNGVSQFKLYSASGLPANYVTTPLGRGSESDENQLSAAGYLQAVRAIVTEYPEIMTRSLPNAKAFAVNDETIITMENQNEMIPGMVHGRPEITGGKTGTGDISGYSLLVQLNMAGRQVLMVTLGDPSKSARYADMGHLLDALETKLEWQPLHQHGETVGGKEKRIPVANGNQPSTQLYYANDVGVFVPNDQADNLQLTLSYRDKLQYDTEGQIQVNAPLTKDETVNEEYYTLPFYQSIATDHDQLGDEIKASEDVPEVSFFVKISRLLSDTMENLSEWFQHFFATL